MINWDKLLSNSKLKKAIIAVMSITVVLIIAIYVIIIHKYLDKKNYTKEVLQVAQKNEETTFSIEKIYLCSSANAVDNTKEKNLKNINIYQYTDMAFYINNSSETNGLTNKNTIKQLYIDNIELEGKNKKDLSLKYTNLLKIGNRESITDFTSSDKIDFNIISTNEENRTADYSSPTFYADCSNPVALKYVNNLGANYSIQEGSKISFDGSILQTVGIPIQDIQCKVKFKINIVNNENQYYSCWVNLEIPLSDIYNGTTIKSASTSGSKYDFFAI